MAYCSACGVLLESDAAFCGECGAPILEETGTEEMQPIAPCATQAQGAAVQTVVEPQITETEQLSVTEQLSGKADKKPGRRLVIVLALCAAVVVLVGVVAVSLLILKDVDLKKATAEYEQAISEYGQAASQAEAVNVWIDEMLTSATDLSVPELTESEEIQGLLDELATATEEAENLKIIIPEMPEEIEEARRITEEIWDDLIIVDPIFADHPTEVHIPYTPSPDSPLAEMERGIDDRREDIEQAIERAIEEEEEARRTDVPTAGPPQTDDLVIKTPYYTITLPEEYRGHFSSSYQESNYREDIGGEAWFGDPHDQFGRTTITADDPRLSFDVVLAPTGSGGWLSFVPSSSWTYREVPNPYEETNEMGGPVSMTKVVVVRSAEYENGSDPGRLDIIAGYLSFQ